MSGQTPKNEYTNADAALLGRNKVLPKDEAAALLASAETANERPDPAALSENGPADALRERPAAPDAAKTAAPKKTGAKKGDGKTPAAPSPKKSGGKKKGKAALPADGAAPAKAGRSSHTAGADGTVPSGGAAEPHTAKRTAKRKPPLESAGGKRAQKAADAAENTGAAIDIPASVLPAPAGGAGDNVRAKPPKRGRVRFRASDSKKRNGFYTLYLKKFLPPRALAGLVCALLLALPVGFLFSGASLVRVYVDGRRAGAGISRGARVSDVLNDCGIDARAEDEVRLASADLFGAVKTLEIARAFAVRVTADGATAQLFTAGDTVAAVLARANVPLGEDDLVEPAPDAILRAGDEIVVRRVTYAERVETQAVEPVPTVKPSPLLADGVTRVMTTHERAGTANVTYRDRYIDGVLADSEIVSTRYTKYPWNPVTLEGNGAVPASPLDGANYTDVAIVGGVPSSYQSVKTAQPCTAYSFDPGVWGASGMFLVQGMVAVNPAEYDYGDLLYITSADGSFVYGWAIAADAGTAMMDGRVEIDCFFETYGESVLFGKKYLDVYVVGRLTQSELEEYIANEGMFRARVAADE